MAEVQKPIVPTTEAGPAEATPAPAAVPAVEKPAEVVEPKVEEPAKTDAVAPVEENKVEEEKKEVEKPVEKPVEPIYSGALGYKAPGLKNAFRFSKKYFWFGDEAIPTQSLSHYLRGEKAEVAHPIAAWSSQTGKGLLYFVKHADQKETPAGVLNLADATDVSKDSFTTFHFKLHSHKHTFEAQTAAERNGWFIAIEKAIEEAKAAKQGIVESEGYKEELSKLGKPAVLAATAAKDSSTPKKSIDAAPKLAEAEPAAASASTPARAGSSSSSSSDEDKKKKKAKSKSRSVSRGKRASIFGGFLGKKDKTEEKKDEAAEPKKEEETATPAAEAAIAPIAVTAPVITSDLPPKEEIKKEETPAPAAEPVVAAAEEKPVEEKKVEQEKPKPAKRGSIFGSFVEKLKSPTTEKKESDVGPPPPAKEPEVAAEAPKIEEIPSVAAVPATEVPTEATPEASKTEEAKVVTPHKERQSFSFGKFLGGAKEKVKSPTTEKTPEVAKSEEAPKIEETPAPIPALEPIEPAAEAPKEEKKEEETPAAATTPTAPKAKRGSIFGNLTGSVKKEGETGEKSQGLKGLFRNASKAGRSKKEKEAPAPPAKVDETAEPKEENATVEAAKVEEKKEETPAAPAEPVTIGDVVPSAVEVGQAPKSTPQVSTTA